MDIGLSSDMYVSYYRYQTLMQQEFQQLAEKHSFQIIEGSKSIASIHKQIKDGLKPILDLDSKAAKKKKALARPQRKSLGRR